MKKLRVGVLGGTGMVGQRFIQILDNHPWFELTEVAASSQSAGKTYAEAVEGRWLLEKEIPVPPEFNGFEHQFLACKEAIEAGRIEAPQMPHAEILYIMHLMDRLRAEWGVRFPGE